MYKPGLVGFVLVVLSVLAAMSGPLGSRQGWWDYTGAVRVIQWAAYAGALSSLLCLSGLILARPGGRRRGFVFSLLGVVIIVPILYFLYSWKQAKQNLPPIQDITTNTDNPPKFWNAPNSRIYGGEGIASLQKEAYPDIKPLELPVSADRAFDLALEVIRDKGWKLWEPDRAEKHIEATEKTFWFGFSDDVVIHITALGKKRSRVDMRSVSRFGGGGDGGTNARRIRDFFKALKKRAGK